MISRRAFAPPGLDPTWEEEFEFAVPDENSTK
jgi:hypothetical protein